jgi:hypothetical protein
MSTSAALGGFVTGNYVPGLGVVDPFGPPLHPVRALLASIRTLRTNLGAQMRAMFHAVSATALFRCWHIILFFSAWATCVSLVSHYVHDLGVQPTLLTVSVPVFVGRTTADRPAESVPSLVS